MDVIVIKTKHDVTADNLLKDGWEYTFWENM